MAKPPQHDPDPADVLDVSDEPLCLICRASFRLRGLSLCSACLHDNQDADPSEPATESHGHAA